MASYKGRPGLYKYRAPKLKKELEFVARRDGFPVWYETDSDGNEYVIVPLASHRFHEAVKDAICKRHEDENNSGIPVYSYETLKNPEKFIRLQMLNWGIDDPEKAKGAPFHVLPGHDRERYEL